MKRAVDMKIFTMHMILSSLMVAACVSSAPGFTSTLGTLHQPAVLSCERNCSGSVRWMKIQKRSGGVMVARCDRTSCSSEDGFSISYHQYLKGDLSLTITAAEYHKRGWYRCLCDGQDVCDVSLRIRPVEVVTLLGPAGSVVLDVAVPERVELVFLRSGDGAQSSVSVCTLDGRKLHCGPEYENRASLTCSLSLTGLNQSVYALRDLDNDEIISTHTLTRAHTGNDTMANDTLPAKGKPEIWNLRRIFEDEYRGVTLGAVITGVCVVAAVWVMKGFSWIRMKVKKRRRADGGHVTSDPDEIKLPMFDMKTFTVHVILSSLMM